MMRLIISILLFICMLPGTQAHVSQHPYADKADSIISVCNSLRTDTKGKVEYLRDMNQQNIGTPWAKKLLDTALIISQRGKYNMGTLLVKYDIYRHYRHNKDSINMRLSFESLRDYSKKIKQYEYYFRSWVSITSFKLAKSDLEYVSLEVEKMLNEARELNYKPGIATAVLERAIVYETIGDEKNALTHVNKAIGMNVLPVYELVSAYDLLMRIAYRDSDFDKAIEAIDKQLAVINNYLKDNPKMREYYMEQLMDAELNYCEIYLAIPDAKKLGIHLDRALKYDRPNTMFSYKERLHVMRGGYYYLNSEWEKSLAEFDKALASIGNVQPFYYSSIMLLKAQVMEESGDLRQAALQYRKAVARLDSLNHVIIEKHLQQDRNNYIIRTTIWQKEAALRHSNMIIISTCSLLVVMLFMVIVYSLYVNSKLKSAALQMKLASDRVKSADKMKEVFLHNIFHEIRIPLNAVMGFSELLSTQDNLNEEEKSEFVSIIKNNASKLTVMIFDILDLSRLESGMYKFNDSDCDISVLFNDVQTMAQYDRAYCNIKIESDIPSITITTDTNRFFKMMQSMFSCRNGVSSHYDIRIVLTNDENYVFIDVEGSPLTQTLNDNDTQNPTELNNIQHKINRIFLDHYGATYDIIKSSGQTMLHVRYPIKRM